MSAVDERLINRFLGAARRRAGWFRFFVPLDGIAVALELKIEAGGQVSSLRMSDQQSATLDEKPRLKSMLIDGAKTRVSMLNRLLEEIEMPWETLRCFRSHAGVFGAIIEAADNRWMEIIREARDPNEDCA